jgi:hypothetical protein
MQMHQHHQWAHCLVEAPHMDKHHSAQEADICPIQFQEDVAIVNFQDIIFRCCCSPGIVDADTELWTLPLPSIISPNANSQHSQQPSSPSTTTRTSTLTTFVGFHRLQYPIHLPLSSIAISHSFAPLLLSILSRTRDVTSRDPSLSHLRSEYHSHSIAPLFGTAPGPSGGTVLSLYKFSAVSCGVSTSTGTMPCSPFLPCCCLKRPWPTTDCSHCCACDAIPMSLALAPVVTSMRTDQLVPPTGSGGGKSSCRNWCRENAVASCCDFVVL